MPEEVKIKLTERDDIADLLGLIPTWMFSALVWYIFSKIILDRFTDKKPGTEINAAIIASDVAGVTFPPGVALAAQIDVTLTALDVIFDIRKFIEEHPIEEIGKTGATTGVVLLDELLKGATAAFLLITRFGR